MIDKRKTPEFSASSMADIAFLLLIFFLVATTMNVDTGLSRVLPPMPPEDQKVKDADVRKRNMLQISINMHNNIQVNQQPIHITQIRDKVKEFIQNITNDENLPEKELVNIPLIGDFLVSKGIVSLQNDRGTSYDVYIQVQNELTRAINEMRNEVAQRYFSKKYADLSQEQMSAVDKAVPIRISEAEPRNIGGN